MSKHVAFVSPINEFYSPITGGAIATILMENARELVKRGRRVSVLTPVGTDEIYPSGEIIPVRCPQRSDLNIVQRALSRLSGRINKWGWTYYDIYLRSVVRELRKLTPAPDTVVFFNDLVAPYYARRKLPAARLLVNLQNEVRRSPAQSAPLFRAIDQLLACSHYIRDWTKAEYNLPTTSWPC